MAGIVEFNHGLGIVFAIGLGAGGQKIRIAVTPYRQGWGLVFAEIALEGGVEADIVLIVLEKVELDLYISRPVQEVLV